MTPFYIGKGSNKRAWSMSRSKYWKRIVAQCGYVVEIIMDGLTEEEAFEKEMEFIRLYKSCGYCEANFTEGGEDRSGFGHAHTRETKSKISKALTGIKRAPMSETHKQKLSKAHLGKTHNKEDIEKRAKSNKGRKRSDETKQLMSDKRKGKNKGSDNPRSKQVVDSLTNKVFVNITAASKYTGINYNTLWGYLSGKRVNKTNLYLNKVQ